MVQQSGLGTATVDRHLERLQRQSPIIHGADRPTDDESGIRVENRCQIQLRVLADHKRGGVADPALNGRGRGKVAVEHVAAIRSS